MLLIFPSAFFICAQASSALSDSLKEHKKKSNGSCVTTYYEGQKCSTCGTIWKGDVIRTVTDAKCTH